MKRYRVLLAVYIGIVSLLCLCGCSIERIQQEEGRQLDFTVTARSELPEEVEAVLDEKLGTEFQTACQYGDSLYLICGYPPQQSGGYSIRVNRLAATEDAVYFQAELIGPQEDGETGTAQESTQTSPWIVVKTAYLDLPVIFEP